MAEGSLSSAERNERGLPETLLWYQHEEGLRGELQADLISDFRRSQEKCVSRVQCVQQFRCMSATPQCKHPKLIWPMEAAVTQSQWSPKGCFGPVSVRQHLYRQIQSETWIKQYNRKNKMGLGHNIIYKQIDLTQCSLGTYWDVINSHAVQSPPVVTEVILDGRICHLRGILRQKKINNHVTFM